MYVYLIKYNGEVIAVAKNDDVAEAVIQEYVTNNKDSKIDNFDKEPIRFFE